ncbi:uncharacterized protein KY384_000765 [Bacidia gigantensis]|uniref:uncharacterized protein n=1 Tax=Bacidia gigantensis TaxID=2732470 RepID=UPI001D038442|nr:uncharacterized protein KY384_000765 [Bacidia gigantensis]KAG8526003.1 hypothetical protein KY384_000765 [Bacidia gigantensis]
MASNSPESPSKKRKQLTNGANLTRDRPLFGSRPSAPTLQQPPDFLTDSLNNSLIPSPSPRKPLTQKYGKANSRKDRPRHSLSAAFHGTAIDNEGSKPRKSSALPIGGIRAQRNPIHRSTTSPQVTSASTAKQNLPTRPRTPTPPRGRQLLDNSPATSEPSPGRGYTEAYQRIVEEENLAHEDTVDDTDLEEFQAYQAEPPKAPDSALPSPGHNSDSPPASKMSRKSSPQIHFDGAVDDDHTEDNEIINGDQQNRPAMMSSDDTNTSSLDSGMSQYGKDLQQLQRVLKSRPKAFSKAHLSDRPGLSLENLRRKNGSSESLRSSRSAGSFSLTGSEPSMNIPKTWGRKARPGNDWLSRINERKAKAGKVPSHRHSAGEEILPRSQKRNGERDGIDDWISAAAEVPLPSSERGSSILTSSSHSTLRTQKPSENPTNHQHNWNIEDDFTGRSLQVSDSPPMRLGGAEFNHDGHEGMNSPERSEVPQQPQKANRESEPEVKISQQTLHQSSSEEEEQRGTSPNRPNLLNGWAPSQQSARAKARFQNEKGTNPESDSHEPALHSKPSSTDVGDSLNPDHDPRDSASQPTASMQRPSQERQDSHDLLRRLSRAASDSPRPDKENIPPQRQGPAQTKVEQTPQVSRPKIYTKTPVVTGAWIDQSQIEHRDISPPRTVMKTPFVTGGWIETPYQSLKRDTSTGQPPIAEEDEDMDTTSTIADLVKKLSPNAHLSNRKPKHWEPLKYTGSALPKSALQSVLNEAKGGDLLPFTHTPYSEDEPTLQLGEDTIQSLEQLVANDTDVSTMLTTPSSQVTSPPSSDPSPKSDTERKAPGESDPQSYTAVLSRLTTLGPSIRDSKRQLASLERAMSHSNSKQPNRNRPQDNDDNCNEAGELHDFIFPCKKCGCGGRTEPFSHDGFFDLRDAITTLHIRIPIPQLLYRRRDDERRRLTWFGLISLLAWILFIGEFIARGMYCQPRYATSMKGFGVDIHAPRPPFVLFKVIYQKTAFGSLLAPFYVLFRIGVKLVGSFVGYLVGFMFGTDTVGEPLVGQAPVLGSGGAPTYGMMDDEYL